MTSATRRQIVQKLGFQIAFLLAAVLLPLTLISMVNSLQAVDEMNARSQAALTGETMLASGEQIRMIHEARGSAAAIASLIAPLLRDDAACTAALQEFAADHPAYAQISFVPLDGQLRCSSKGKRLDLSMSPIFRDTIRTARPSFSVSRNGPISGTSVLVVTHPVLAENKVYLGFVSVSLAHTTLAKAAHIEGADAALDLLTFDRNGRILASSIGLDRAAEALPRDRPLTELLPDHPLVFSALSQTGQRRFFSILPLVPGELFALGTWPADRQSNLVAVLSSIPFLLPALIWFASVVVAWMSVEWLVNRHIRQLNRSIKSFAGGNRMLTDVDVAGAPLEIREIGAAFEQMTDAVMRDEAELEDTLHQKEVLLREVHHRVKNNLQMIASIMNMHGRKARTTETRQVIKALQGRVMSLATIHRELYQTAGEGDIHVAELLDAVARQTVNVAGGTERRFDLRMEMDDIHLTPDQAVPLALLAGEGLMNAVALAPPQAPELPHLDLRLMQTAPDGAALLIEGAADEAQGQSAADMDDTMGLSVQLMTAFAMQLGGKMEQATADGTYRLRVDFQLRPLVEGEHRHAANTKSPD
jgi:two-component system, sensor histidine kinase PdtaS